MGNTPQFFRLQGQHGPCGYINIGGGFIFPHNAHCNHDIQIEFRQGVQDGFLCITL